MYEKEWTVLNEKAQKNSLATNSRNGQKDEEDYEWQDIVKSEDGSLRTETRIVSSELEEPSWNNEDRERVQKMTEAIHCYLGEGNKLGLSFLLPQSTKQKQQ